MPKTAGEIKTEPICDAIPCVTCGGSEGVSAASRYLIDIYENRLRLRDEEIARLRGDIAKMEGMLDAAEDLADHYKHLYANS